MIPADARVLPINAAQTRVYIRAYRSGRLARLGHNHVISAHGVSGTLWLHADAAHSGFHLEIPVALMRVDDPMVRAASGAAFERPVSSRDAAATRRNMLGEAVLDAERFPIIEISSITLEGELPNLEVTVLVTLKGISNTLVSPALVTLTDRQLVASGAISVAQRAFNITPYSALGGALSVRDDIDIEYRIVADLKSR